MRIMSRLELLFYFYFFLNHYCIAFVVHKVLIEEAWVIIYQHDIIRHVNYSKNRIGQLNKFYTWIPLLLH